MGENSTRPLRLPSEKLTAKSIHNLGRSRNRQNKYPAMYRKCLKNMSNRQRTMKATLIRNETKKNDCVNEYSRCLWRR